MMLLGDTINVFITLSLTFALTALLVSGVVEGVSSMLKWRSATLLRGLKDLLNDQDLRGLAGDLLAHGAINPLSSGVAANPVARFMPSYIPPLQFADALIDVLQNPPARPEVRLDLKSAIDGFPDLQIQGLLQGIYARVGGDAVKMRQEVASWFDNSMDRLSGSYKRRVQLFTFGCALVFALALNIDAFHLVKAMWGHAAVIAVTPDAVAKVSKVDAGQLLLTLPVGWDDPPNSGWRWFSYVFGCLTTATAALFGAPFWFDTLQQFVQLRGTGTAPDDKPKPPAATA